MGRLDAYMKFQNRMSENLPNSYEALQRVQDFIDTHTGINAEMGIFAKVSIYLTLNQSASFRLTLEKLETSEHPIILFLTYHFYALYYRGFNNPRINIEKSELYGEKARSIYKEIKFENDWEKGFTEIMIIEDEFLQEKDLEKKLIIPCLQDS